MTTSDKIDVIQSSDNLLRPKKWVSEIRKYPDGRVEYAVQFVGIDEGSEPTWHNAATVSEARKSIKAKVKKNEN